MRLTTTDAFFVAYQAETGVPMHFGAEVELDGTLDRAMLDRAVGRALARWPALGQTVRRGVVGLRWEGATRDVVVESRDPHDVVRWRTTIVDPFREPPFRVLWVRANAAESMRPRTGQGTHPEHLRPASERTGVHTLAFRCHHACADGQLFFAIVTEILCGLVGGERPAPRANGHPLAFAKLWPRAKLAPMWRHTRALAREARLDRSARLAARATSTTRDDADARRGVSTLHRIVEPRAIEAAAARARVRPPWLVLAAWLQALHAWNARRGEPNPVFSVEVPVGLRRGAAAMAGTGNHLSVLTLFADPRTARDELARALWRDYAGGVRRGVHLAVPLLSAPLGLLPWRVFRRAAMTQTGFATTHFTWLAHEPDPRAEVASRSRGALAIRDHRIYTPVCLRMGAALAVLAWRDELRLTITHRVAALDGAEAAELGELLVANLR